MLRSFWEQPRRCSLIHPSCTAPGTTLRRRTWWWLGATTLWCECGGLMSPMWTASSCRSLRVTAVSSTPFVLTLKVFCFALLCLCVLACLACLFHCVCWDLPNGFPFKDSLMPSVAVRKEDVLRGQHRHYCCVEDFSRWQREAAAMSSLVFREGLCEMFD